MEDPSSSSRLAARAAAAERATAAPPEPSALLHPEGLPAQPPEAALAALAARRAAAATSQLAAVASSGGALTAPGLLPLAALIAPLALTGAACSTASEPGTTDATAGSSPAGARAYSDAHGEKRNGTVGYAPGPDL